MWNDEAKQEQSKRIKAKGFSDSLRKAHAAAMARPDSQRGEQHREAKVWLLIDPEGHSHHVINLMQWAREHAEWFDVPANDTDRERIARNIRSGFGQIVQSRLGHRKDGVYTYKNWTLGDWPREKEEKQ